MIQFYSRDKDRRRVRIAVGWEKAGLGGWCYGYINLTQTWALVVMDGSDIPRLYRIESIEEKITTIEWRALTI